ncbi:hypothetical protein [Burkholderia sp. LMG 32019]
MGADACRIIAPPAHAVTHVPAFNAIDDGLARSRHFHDWRRY